MRRPCLSLNLLILFADFISNSFAQFDFGKETAGFFQFGKLPEEAANGNVSTEASQPIAERRSQPFTVFADLTQTSTKDPVFLGKHLAEDKISDDLPVNSTKESGEDDEGRIEERDLGHGHGGGGHGGG